MAYLSSNIFRAYPDIFSQSSWHCKCVFVQFQSYFRYMSNITLVLHIDCGTLFQYQIWYFLCCLLQCGIMYVEIVVTSGTAYTLNDESNYVMVRGYGTLLSTVAFPSHAKGRGSRYLRALLDTLKKCHLSDNRFSRCTSCKWHNATAKASAASLGCGTSSNPS